MKNLFVNIVVLALLLNLSSSLSYADNQVWKIGHVRPIGSSVDKDIRGLTKEISEKTDGQISFEVYPASKLGDYSLVQERCSFGEVEMYVGPFGTTIDRRLAPACDSLSCQKLARSQAGICSRQFIDEKRRAGGARN